MESREEPEINLLNQAVDSDWVFRMYECDDNRWQQKIITDKINQSHLIHKDDCPVIVGE